MDFFRYIQPTDPAAGYADAITGDFYYNSSTGQFKNINTGGAPIGTWASGGNLNSPRRYICGRNTNVGGGSNSSALAFGGYETSARAFTESYDGTQAGRK